MLLLFLLLSIVQFLFSIPLRNGLGKAAQAEATFQGPKEWRAERISAVRKPMAYALKIYILNMQCN